MRRFLLGYDLSVEGYVVGIDMGRYAVCLFKRIASGEQTSKLIGFSL
jgi:hypothetical protein